MGKKHVWRLIIGGIDHISLHVNNLEKSKRFYSSVLLLKEVPRPNFDFKGAWYEMQNGNQIHLIDGREKEVDSHNRGTHFAIYIESVLDFEQEMISKNYPIEKPAKKRIDGNMHLFLKDPDGYYIEFVEKS